MKQVHMHLTVVIETTESLSLHKHLRFQTLIPERVKAASDNDLRLSLVSLKNAQSAISVHVMRIERELSSRNVSKYIIHQERDS